MKKILVLLLVAFVLSTCFAEELDLTALTDGELIDLLESVETEMTDRGNLVENCYWSDVPYTVGEEIPAGTYLITCVKKEISALTGGSIGIWKSMDDFLNQPDEPFAEPFIVLEDSTRLDLKEGEIVFCQYGTFLFKQIG